jgi:DNA-binding NtrC family response regulator
MATMAAEEVSRSGPDGAPASRILLIAAEGSIQHALVALLRDHQVIVCSDPDAAAALAQKHDVDTVICSQRVPPATGVEVLRAVKSAHARGMRVLLTDRPEGRLLLDAINEVEVFRCVDLPWNNAAMRELANAAARGARVTPVLGSEPPTTDEAGDLKRHVALVVIESDADAQQRLRDVLQPHYKMHFANEFERALVFMEQHETGAVICATRVGRSDLVAPLKALKQSHPQITAIAIDAHLDVDLTIELINEAQVFRLLRRPLHPTICRQYADAAMARYWRIKQNPQAAWRFVAAPARGPRSPQQLPPGLLNRIRGLPGRLVDADGAG